MITSIKAGLLINQSISSVPETGGRNINREGGSEGERIFEEKGWKKQGKKGGKKRISVVVAFPPFPPPPLPGFVILF